MPIYVFRCVECGARYDVFRVSPAPPEPPSCIHCDGQTRLELQPATPHFHGSGFYATDYKRREKKDESE